MLGPISRSITSRGALTRSSGRHYVRRFSLISIHSSFPASLLRYNSGQRSSLFDYGKQPVHHTTNPDDGVVVSGDGLVYPAISKTFPFSNGATLMPNTFLMQELIRASVDEYIEALDNGSSVETPLIYRIPKGTPIPSMLILLREHTASFSLQPSQPMLLEDLNKRLDEFYAKYGEKWTAERWLDEHDFENAVPDDALSAWGFQ